MIDKILVPIDGSDYSNKALDYAIELARKFSSEILLVHVVPTTTAIISGSETIGSSVLLDLRRQFEESGHRILSSGEAKIREAGIKVTTKLEYGSLPDSISKIGKEEDVSLIVIGERGLGAVTRFLLGSVSNKVSHHATCPVLIVK